MKFLLLGIVTTIIVAATAFYFGYMWQHKSQTINEMKFQMHNEHSEIAYKIDSIKIKLDSMDKKLDMLVNIATRPISYDMNPRN